MREADEAADRGDVDDRPAAGLAHPPRRGLADVERAAQVHGEHVVPLLGRQRVDVADLAHAGRVDDHVDAAVALDRRGDCALDVGRRCGRRRRRGRSPTTPAPSAANTLGDLAPDPARGAGDERDAAFAAACAQYRPIVARGRSTERGTRASRSPTSTARSTSTAASSASSCASRRLYEEREIAEIVDVPEATAWDIAFLRIPGSDVEIELLEYKGCERRSGSAPARATTAPGTSRCTSTTSTRSTPTSPRAASCSARPGRSSR